MINKILKRTFDVIFATVAILITSPIWLITIIGILVSDFGPVFYVSSRVGKDLKTFRMYKFRSMSTRNVEKATEFIANSSNIFPFGRFIRNYKIDELPQLINIFLGDMSVVGPRPCSPLNYDKIMTEKQLKNYASVRPGLTSPGSLFEYVYGDGIEDNVFFEKYVMREKMKWESMYIENNNFLQDLFIIIRTAVIILQKMVGSSHFLFTQKEKQLILEYTQTIQKYSNYYLR